MVAISYETIRKICHNARTQVRGAHFVSPSSLFYMGVAVTALSSVIVKVYAPYCVIHDGLQSNPLLAPEQQDFAAMARNICSFSRFFIGSAIIGAAVAARDIISFTPRNPPSQTPSPN